MDVFKLGSGKCAMAAPLSSSEISSLFFSPYTLHLSLSSSSSLYSFPFSLPPSLFLPFTALPSCPITLSAYVYFNMESIASESCFANFGLKQFHININDPVQGRQNRLVIYFFSSRIYAGVKLLLFTCLGV